MTLHLACALLVWQQPAQQPTAPALPQPIARVAVKPADFALQVGDTVRLHATAYDSSGRAMAEATIHWFASGGRFEGTVDSTGLVSAGATGSLNVAAVAGLPGRTVKPTVAFIPNGANAWGAIYRDGLIYVPDNNSGLWVVRVEPPQPLIP